MQILSHLFYFILVLSNETHDQDKVLQLWGGKGVDLGGVDLRGRGPWRELAVQM